MKRKYCLLICWTKTRLFFYNDKVAAMFERYGRLKSITVPMDINTNKNKGFAFVEFEDRRDAEDAFEKFDGFSVEGRRLRLDW